MRAKARQRALRLIASQLIASDLSPSDLRDVAYEMRSGTFGEELIYLLGPFFHQDAQYENLKSVESEEDDDLLLLAQRKRLSKKALFELMQQVGDVWQAGISPDLTMREMIVRFIGWATPQKIDLLQSVLKDEDYDSYLSGIMNRK